MFFAIGVASDNDAIGRHAAYSCFDLLTIIRFEPTFRVRCQTAPNIID